MENVPAPLYSPEIEKSLISSILLDSGVLTGLITTPQDFHIERNRWVFEAINHLAECHEPVDYLTVCEYLDRTEKLTEIGGPAFIMGFFNTEAVSYNAPAYAAILREKARRRELVKVANEIARVAYNEANDIDTSIPGLVEGLVNTSSVQQGAQHISTAMSELYDEVDERVRNPKDIWGIGTGFPTFDSTTGGLQKGELMILAGTPGVGKSILGADFAAGMAKNAPGVIYSLEMKKKQVARRLVSGKTEISTRALKTGRMAEEDFPIFTNAIEYFSNLPIYIADSQGWTTTSLRADLARLKAQHHIEWFVLDYLFLLSDGGKDEIERTSAASKGLKRTTNELNLAGIAIHSLNKTGMAGGRTGDTGEDGLPNGLNDLRGSGQVAYDADLACFLTKYNNKVVVEQIEPQHRDRARVLWFGKGRELENPRQYVVMMQKAGFPAFTEYASDNKARY